MDASNVKLDSLGELDFMQLTEDEIQSLLAPFEIPGVSDTSSRDVRVSSVDKFIQDQKKPNTLARTKADVRNIQRWLFDMKKEPRAIENIPPSHLNDYLAELFVSIRKVNGENYEPVSLESMKNSVERHLKENGYPVSLKDRAFIKAISALHAKKVELTKLGRGRQPNKSFDITPEEEEKLYEAGALGNINPKSLITTIFYQFGTQFGLRAGDEARQLDFGDITVRTSVKGDKYLEFKEKSTKTRDGSDVKNQRETTPKIYSSPNLPEYRDPVKLYEMYVRRRPETMMKPDDPFYLTPIPVKRLAGTDSEPWYYARPIGHNTLRQLLKGAAETAKLDKKITNHSVRKTTVTKLSQAGVPPQKIMKITGHKNIQSITHYDGNLSEKEHRNFCSILQGASVQSLSNDAAQSIVLLKEVSNIPKPNSVSTCTSSSSTLHQSGVGLPLTRNPFQSGCTFNNCTFNF